MIGRKIVVVKAVVCLCLVTGLPGFSSIAQPISSPVQRSISASRQFIVYGTTPPLRGAVANTAEETKAGVLAVLNARDDWKIPIILNVNFPQANVPELPQAAVRFSQTGSGLKIQLDLTIAADLDVLNLRRQLLRVILLEMIYRQLPDLPAGAAYVAPPDWLVEATLRGDPVQDKAAVVAAITSLGSDSNLASIDRFLEQKFGLLDSAGQLLYRGYAMAFLNLLLNQPDGRIRLSTYISNLPQSTSDPAADLKQHFPVLARSDISRLWKESLTNLNRRQYQLLSAAQSERRLIELLGDPRQPAPDLQSYLAKPKQASARSDLRSLKEQLMVLGVEANPMLRPLVLGYEGVVERISSGKTRGIRARLDHLASARSQLRARATEIDDYMNWFELTKADDVSGTFKEYGRAAAHAGGERFHRRDPLSVYLDALEEQF